MTVAELKYELSKYDDSARVYVGSDDHVYTIDDLEEKGVLKYHGDDIDSAPMLIVGKQCGVIGK